MVACRDVFGTWLYTVDTALDPLSLRQAQTWQLVGSQMGGP